MSEWGSLSHGMQLRPHWICAKYLHLGPTGDQCRRTIYCHWYMETAVCSSEDVLPRSGLGQLPTGLAVGSAMLMASCAAACRGPLWTPPGGKRR